MITPEDIRLYPMTQDVTGQRTHEEYVNSMANMVLNLMIDYRLDPDTLYKLALYAMQGDR